MSECVFVRSFVHPYMYNVQRTCCHLKANILCICISRLMWRWRRWRYDQRYMAVFAFLLLLLVFHWYRIVWVRASVCAGLNFSVSLLLLLLLSLFCTHSICDDARMKHDSTVGFFVLFVYFFLRLRLFLLSYLSSFLSVFFRCAKLGRCFLYIFISPRRWV